VTGSREAVMPGAGSGRIGLLWPVLVVGMGWLYFMAGSYYGIYLPQIRVSSIAIATIVLLAWLVVALREPRWRPRSAFMPAIAVALGALTVSAATSRNPRISADFIVYAVLLAGLYLLLRTLLTDPRIRARFGALAVALAVMLMGVYLALTLRAWIDWWGLVGRLAVPPLRPQYEGLTYGNPGFVAALAMLSWLVVAGAIGGGGRASRIAVASIGALTLASVLVSGTRGAWLAVAVTAAVAGVLVLLLRGRERRAGQPMSRRGRVLLVVGGLAVAVAVIVIGPVVADRVVNGGDGGRFAYWAAAVRMFLAAPLTGVGPGMWAPERILFTVAPDLDYYIPHAHDIYLQTAAELGIVGLGAGVVVVLVVGRVVLDALRGGDPERRRWAVVAVLATVYFGAHQVFDFMVNMPAALFVFAIPFAWLDATLEPRPSAAVPVPARRRWSVHFSPRVVAAAVVIVLLAGAGFSGWSEASALRFDTATAAAERGDWSVAVAPAADAAATDPTQAPYQLVLGLALARAGRSAEAATALSTAASLDDLPTAWLNLADLRASAGDAAGARSALASALRLGDQQAPVDFAAGFVYERIGDVAPADASYATTLAMIPGVAGDAFWRDPARAARFDGILAAALPMMSPAGRFEAFLMLGDAARAEAAAAAIPDPSGRQVAELVLRAWGGDRAAESELQGMAKASPRDTVLTTWCARIADRNGEPETASTYRYWSVLSDAYANFGGFAVVALTDPPAGALLAGATWPTYGLYTYRRFTPTDQLLPDLPHLVLRPEAPRG
jgi:O-antigen ligase/tetratricopeptide (TPR) repeat protein